MLRMPDSSCSVRVRYLKGSFSVFKGSDDYEVVIDFDRWASDLIRGRRRHASQELLELPKGSLRMRLRLNNSQVHGSG